MTPAELKTSIIQLGLQGKLVSQIPSEGTGQDLLRDIEFLRKKSSQKKEKPFPSIDDDDVPFDIPTVWTWAYIGQLFSHNTGKALNSSDRDGRPLEYITTSNVYWDSFVLDKLKTMLFTKDEESRCTVQKGDLLVLEGGDVGRSAIWNYDFPMRIQNHIHRLRPYGEVSIKFFYYVFFYYKASGRIAGKGIGIQGLSTGVLHNLIVPLPPLHEQKRIVARIEELMPLVDEYTKVWNRIEELSTCFPDNLEKSILQLAFEGRLVPQIGAEGTGDDLYLHIRQAKRRKEQQGLIKKGKALPPIAANDIPFEIPASWKWVRWGDVSDSIQYGYNAPAKNTGRIKMVRISDIHDDSVDWPHVPYCDIPENEISTYLLQSNDILFARTGGTVGKSFLVRNVREPSIYAGYLIRTRFETELIYPEFMRYFMNSPLYWSQLRNGTIATAQPNCNGQTLSKMILPLPPYDEQKRIAEKLNELLSMCRSLR